MSEPLEMLRVRIIESGRPCYERKYNEWDMRDDHRMGYRVWEGEIIGGMPNPRLHHQADKEVFMVGLQCEPESIPHSVIQQRLEAELPEGVGAYAKHVLRNKHAVVITNSQWVEDRYATYQFVKDVLTESGNL